MKKREKLTPEEVEELSSFIQDSSSDSVEIKRAQAIIMLYQEMSFQMIRQLTGYGRRHSFHLRKKYFDAGLNGIRKKKKKPKRLLTRGQIEQICKMLHEETPKDYSVYSDFWTTTILALIIREKFGVQYKSKTSLYLIFKEAKFSFHKPGFKYHERNQPKIDEWKKQTKEQLGEFLNNNNAVILAEDEMMLTTKTTFQKIWLPQGEFPQVDVSTKRKLRCIYGYLNVKNGVEHAFKTSGANSKETIDTLEKIGKFYKGKKIIVFWDNAIWHKSSLMKEYLKATKHDFHLINFPPYAPDENPQEHVWKEGRARITHNTFIGDIDKATDDFVTYLNNTPFKYQFMGQ